MEPPTPQVGLLPSSAIASPNQRSALGLGTLPPPPQRALLKHRDCGA